MFLGCEISWETELFGPPRRRLTGVTDDYRRGRALDWEIGVSERSRGGCNERGG